MAQRPTTPGFTARHGLQGSTRRSRGGRSARYPTSAGVIPADIRCTPETSWLCEDMCSEYDGGMTSDPSGTVTCHGVGWGTTVVH